MNTDTLLAEYRIEHDRCAVCYSKGEVWNPLEIHHVVSRGYRKDLTNDRRNLLVLCRDCHFGFHSGGGRNLDLGHVLMAKQELGELDLAFLALLRNRTGLKEDPKELPVWAMEERLDNGGGWWSKRDQ